jgi:copper chaperone
MLKLDISDMTCGHCASTIARAIRAVDDKARPEFDMAGRVVRVAGSDASDQEFIAAIRAAGYSPVAKASGAVSSKTAGCCGCS